MDVFGILLFSLCVMTNQLTFDDSDYRIGTSIKDATGTVVGVAFNGYGEITETGKGIHSRLYARTFVFVHKNSNSTIAITNIDICFIDQGVKMEVVKRLEQKGLGDVFAYHNVLITSTHTHAGPGGYSWYKMYNMPQLSFCKEEFEAVVNSVVDSIVHAYSNLSDGGRVYINNGLLYNVTINRSKNAYNKNPRSERMMYEDGETDKNIIVLRMENEKRKEIGAIIWFPLHGVSMPGSNRLVDSDNHGYAQFLFEKVKSKKKNFILGDESNDFLCAFPSANHGDGTPNTEGAFCDNGDLCEIIHSTCKKGSCNGRGPGYPSSEESTRIIGERVFDYALELYEQSNEVVSGPIIIGHKFVQLDDVTIEKKFSSSGKEAKTCRASFGASFAAGTTDGPGLTNVFQQGDLKGTKLIDFISAVWKTPTKEQAECQSPKPILFEVGPGKNGIGWVPNVLPLSLVLFGRNLVIAGVPSEFTTMAGRRLKEGIMKYFERSSIVNKNAKFTTAFSNGYHGYTTTYEEYHAQRYEGACTLFGKHQLDAYIQEFSKIAESLINEQKIPLGKKPADLYGQQTDMTFPDIFDVGSVKVKEQVKTTYSRGETVKFIIRGGYPLNFLGRGSTFLKIEKKTGEEWDLVLTDSDFDTYFEWKKSILQENFNTFSWKTSDISEAGVYRFRVFGTQKSILQKLTDYEVVSNDFALI